MVTVNEIIGFIKLKGGEQFSRDLKGRLQGVRENFLSINNAIAGTGLVLFLKNVNEAANSLSQANRQLAATSKLTGVDLGTLSSIAKNAENTFKLSTQQANQFTIAVSKLTGKAGELGKTGDAISRLLDLAAAQGLDAEQALVAINQAILGIDEGTDKLFQKNPSAIYEEYAKQIGTTAGKLNDQQKAQALLNAVMTDGLKVQGEYENFLNSAAGKQMLFENSLQKTSATMGTMAQTVLTPFLELLTKVVDWFNQLSVSSQNLVVTLGAVTTAVYLFGGAVKALLGPWGLAITVVTAFIGLLTGLEINSGKAAQAVDQLKEKLEGFRAGLAKLSTQQAMMQLTFMRAELKRTEIAFENAAFNTPHDKIDRALTAQLLAKRDELRAQIKELEKTVLQRLDPNAPKKTAISPDQKEIDAAKERLDNQRDYEFEHQEISRAQYVEYLKTRQQDFTKWSNEWLNLQRQIMAQEKAIAEQGPGAKAIGTEELKKAQDLGAAIIETYRQQNEEAQKLRETNFANSITALDKQAQFEFETQEISREQYLNYLRRRVDDETAWSEEWLGLKRQISQMETEIKHEEDEKQKAIDDAAKQRMLSNAQALQTAMQSITATFITDVKEKTKGMHNFWKALALQTLEYLEKQYLLSAISSILQTILNPITAVKNSTALAIAGGLLGVAKAGIAAMAEGTVATKPTLALVGEGRGDAFEVVAPQRKFDAFTDTLLRRALGRADKNKPSAQKNNAVEKAVANLNLVQALRDIAALAQRNTFVQNSRQQISNFTENVFSPLNNVALAGANRFPTVEFSGAAMAPAPSPRPAEIRASSREWQPRQRERSVVINNHFASPLNDRRTAQRLSEEVLRPEVRREISRNDKKLQLPVLNEE